MIRLWPRIGVFRMLSVAVLVLGVVAGIYLSAGRQSQQRVIQSAHGAQSEQDEQRELLLMQAEWRQAAAASRSAQRDAQAKADAAASAAADQAKAAEDAARKKQPPVKPADPGTPSKPPNFGPIPASCNEYTGNVATGCALLLQAGFGLDQMTCLKNLWMKESGWNEKARNGSAGGIPQALPMKKMSVFGADYATNPATQILWGLDYIKSHYRTPCGAWSNWQAKGWY